MIKMGKRMDTKCAIDKYIETLNEKTKKTVNKMIDPDVIVLYEKNIGKSVFDMSMDEIYELVKVCALNLSKTPSSSIVFKFVKFFSNLTDWYSDNVEHILSPVRKARVTNTDCFERVIEDEPVLDKEYFESIIKTIKEDQDLWEEKRIYMEMILRLFYDGFYNSDEIIMLKEKDIDFQKMSVKIGDRNVQLTEKTFNLLLYCHNINECNPPNTHREGIMYKGSYIKFFTKDINSFTMGKSNNIVLFRNNLNSVVFKTLRDRYNFFIRGRQIHIIGVYEKIKNIFGDATDQIIRATDRESNAKLRATLELIGTPISLVNFKSDSLRCIAKRK